MKKAIIHIPRRIFFAALITITVVVIMAIGGRAANITPSPDEITLKDTDSTVSFEVNIHAEKDFAGAELGLATSSPDVTFENLAFSDQVGENQIQTTKDGKQYFGFYTSDNGFKAGKYKVATLTYHYNGHTPQSIALDSSKVVTVNQDGTTTGDTSSKNFTVSIKRVKTPAEPKISLNKAKIVGLKDKIYNGKIQKQNLKAIYKGKTLPITLSYKGSRKNIGTGYVVVTGIKNCTGTKKLAYKILPGTGHINSISKVRFGKATVKVKALQGGVRYQVQAAKGKTIIKQTGKTTKIALKLKKKGKYTIKVRAYKKVNGKTYYGKWSKGKTLVRI